MRCLSVSDLQSVSGGATGATAAAMRVFATVSLGIGYTNGIRLMPALGVGGSTTRVSTTGIIVAGVLGGITTHSLLNDSPRPPEQLLALAMSMGFLCGAGVGVGEGLLTASINSFTD